MEETRAQMTTTQESASIQPTGDAQTYDQQGAQQASAAEMQQADPEQRKMIQQRLMLYLHAASCKRRANLANAEDRHCSVPDCKVMKNLLRHMSKCRAGNDCTVMHCSSCRMIIVHWKGCVRGDCTLCLPLRDSEETWPSNTDAAAAQPNSQPSPGQQDAQRAFDAGGTAAPPTAPTGFSENQIAGRGLGTQSQPAAMANGSAPLSSDPSAVTVSTAAGGEGLVGGQTSAPAVVVTANVPQERFDLNDDRVVEMRARNTKEWHKSVTTDLRRHLVKELLQAIAPDTSPQAMMDRRMHNLILYARKVEVEMFEAAISRANYYHLVADKIYRLRSFMDEKRQKRKQRQLQLQAQQQRQLQAQQEQQQQQPQLTEPVSNGQCLRGFSAQVDQETPQQQRPKQPKVRNGCTHVDTILNRLQQQKLQQWFSQQQLLLLQMQQRQ